MFTSNLLIYNHYEFSASRADKYGMTSTMAQGHISGVSCKEWAHSQKISKTILNNADQSLWLVEYNEITSSCLGG